MPERTHDHDYDGRPPVGDDDPLLELLIRWHPEYIPAELIDELAKQRPSPRCNLLAAAE